MQASGIKVDYITVKNMGHANRIISGLEDRILDFFDESRK